MSIEPCQICGGSGFVLRLIPGATPSTGDLPSEPRPYDPKEGTIPDGMESVVCESCSGSGVSAGL
jgi:hypothetical protein